MTRFLGIVGAILFGFGIAGGVAIDSFANPIVLFHVGAGLLCLVVWLVTCGVQSFGTATQVMKGRSTRYGTNAIFYIAVVAAIIVAANWIINRHNKRWDLTEQHVYSLAPQTVSLIQGLQAPLKLISFKGISEDDLKLSELLYMYKNENPSKVSVEIIDPRAKPQLVDRYGMKAGNLIYLELEAGEDSAVSRINEATEDAVTNAILKLTKGAAKKIYFVQGHDEPSITAQDAGGFTQLASALKDEHLNVEPLIVGTVGAIPTDAAAVILASPKKPLLPQEVKLLTEYAQNGGRLLLLHDPRTTGDIATIAATFGIQIRNDVILDQMQRLFAGPTIGAEPIAVDYDTKNPITKNFTNQNITIYNIASSLKKGADADKDANYSEFVHSSETAWGETDLKALLDTDPPAAQKDAVDTAGPLTLGMSYEKKLSGGDTKDAQNTKVARVVVFGDSDWVLNANLRVYANRDLFLNSVNWLAGEEGGVSIRSGTLRASLKPVPRATLMLILISSFLVPELILLCGLSVWWKRRSLATA